MTNLQISCLMCGLNIVCYYYKCYQIVLIVFLYVFIFLFYNFISFPNFKTWLCLPSMHCYFLIIYCSSTLSGEHIHCQEICAYKTLCTFRQESIYISAWAFDTILIYLYMCVIIVSVNISNTSMFKPNSVAILCKVS